MQSASGPGCTTHPSLHLRDANDAHIVFEAVRLRIIPLIKRRLTSDERDQLCSGNVFVWEEAEHKGGLERWTDGRRWSQSRMKGEYLFYEEKMETTEEEKQAKAARRATRNAGNPVQAPATRRQDRPSKPNGLTKQTYSTQLYLSGLQSPRKWHIVAYFSGNDYNRLPVVEDFEYFRRIHIPHGVFFSAKGLVKKTDGSHADGDADDDYSASSSMYSGDEPQRSSPLQQFAPKVSHQGALPSSDSFYGSRVEDGYFAALSSVVLRSLPPRLASHDSGTLPRLSTVAPLTPSSQSSIYSPSYPSPSSRSSNDPGTHHHPQSYASPRNYRPLSPEDRRALSTFKVVL